MESFLIFVLIVQAIVSVVNTFVMIKHISISREAAKPKTL